MVIKQTEQVGISLPEAGGNVFDNKYDFYYDAKRSLRYFSRMHKHTKVSASLRVSELSLQYHTVNIKFANYIDLPNTSAYARM